MTSCRLPVLVDFRREGVADDGAVGVEGQLAGGLKGKGLGQFLGFILAIRRCWRAMTLAGRQVTTCLPRKPSLSILRRASETKASRSAVWGGRLRG